MTDSHVDRMKEARDAVHEAALNREATEARWPEVRTISSALRVRREKNNFAAMIAAAMRGTP